GIGEGLLGLLAVPALGVLRPLDRLADLSLALAEFLAQQLDAFRLKAAAEINRLADVALGQGRPSRGRPPEGGDEGDECDEWGRSTWTQGSHTSLRMCVILVRVPTRERQRPGQGSGGRRRG